MKHVFATACAVAALCGTAIAQTPATPAPKDKMAPAVTKETTAPAAKETTAPAAKSGMMGARAQGTAQVTFYTVAPADVRGSDLMGATVYNVNNENIGEIEDIIIDDGKTLRAVVIGVGGFLGIGEHDVAVEPSALMVTRDQDKDAVRVVLNTTKEDLKNAPAVKFDKASREQAATGNRMPPATTGAASEDPMKMKKDK